MAPIKMDGMRRATAATLLSDPESALPIQRNGRDPGGRGLSRYLAPAKLQVKGVAAPAFSVGQSHVFCGDAMNLYEVWPEPTVIVSDGGYGVAGFPGDPPTAEELPGWYEPHVASWSRHATPQTTLWFWNTELGWANVHPILVKHGWKFRNAHVWNKGIAHASGNTNTQVLRKFPVVSEVCIQYVRDVKFPGADGSELAMRDWLRGEWFRSGIPLYKANEACGVKNAATRKYLTADHLWYFPPPEMFEGMVRYANEHGRPEGRPYFSLDGKRALTGKEWERMRAKFTCEMGVTNVWDAPAVRGSERFKQGTRVVHLNQKPLGLTELILRASSDRGDVIWEPFGGLCTAAVAALRLDRACYAAEIVPEYYQFAVKRLQNEAKLQAPLEAFVD